MIATVATLALLGFVLSAFVRTLRHDSAKIIAALAGRSWLSEPPQSMRPVTVRFSQRYPAIRPMRARPEWRAAA